MNPDLKSGLVAIVGRANAGKSTLLNALVGTKLAITTPKAETTRHLIQGVLNHANGQAVFVDTPGFITQTKSRLAGKLLAKIRQSLSGVDLILDVVDPTRSIGSEERHLLALIKKINKPKILVINKIDLPKKRLTFLEDYLALADTFTSLLQVSALKAQHLKTLVKVIFDYLPEGEPLYPPDQITNIDTKFFVEELIREKIFFTMGDEVPYTVTVKVVEMTQKPKLLYIKAMILTTDSRYKKMIIGKGGAKIKEIGATARKELEIINNQKVYLDLEVAVQKDWEREFV